MGNRQTQSSVAMTEAKAYEELQIKDDFMFGIVMGNPRYCKPFLERVLGIRIERIEYPKSQATIDIAADAKSVRLDIYAEGDNAAYCIEMQISKNNNIPKRTRYYGGMIDLNLLEKGENYRDLKRCFVIFVCTFDLFGKGRHIYTFENRCIQETDLPLGDEVTKIILNTKGTMDDITPEMKKLLDYIDGKEPADDYTRELDAAVQAARKNEKWRLDYMTLQMHYQEKFEQGVEQGVHDEKCRSAMRMLKSGRFSNEDIALFSGLTVEEVLGLEKEAQLV